MNSADYAYEAAKREIARVAGKGEHSLDLSGTMFNALTQIPPQITMLTRLQTLHLNNTQITDLAPLAGLDQLRELAVANTMVIDLRPITKLGRLGASTLADGQQTVTMQTYKGLQFLNSEVSRRDARLAEFAQIAHDQERTLRTLEYLRSLPPWPEPYTPAATPDGSPPKPIGGVPEREKIKTAQTQVQHLIRNATVTRVTAQAFASQIEEALRDVPATHGNQLAEPLQTMQEFAEVLRGLAPETTPTDDPLQTAHLELRISQLEALVDRLTRQLADETKAREAAEALAKKEGLISTHNKAFAAEAGKWNARLVYIGVPSAAFYFLGAENPLAILLSKVMAGAIK